MRRKALVRRLLLPQSQENGLQGLIASDGGRVMSGVPFKGMRSHLSLRFDKVMCVPFHEVEVFSEVSGAFYAGGEGEVEEEM